MDWKAIWEALKELLRLALFAAISAFITSLLGGLESLGSNQVWVIVLTGALRFADKWVHENANVKARGILPF